MEDKRILGVSRHGKRVSRKGCGGAENVERHDAQYHLRSKVWNVEGKEM